jgi:hypothetical protein
LALIAPQAASAAGSGSFAPTGSMSTARDAPAMARLADGRVLVAGGRSGPLLASAEVYNPATGSFSPVGSMGTARVNAAAALLPDGRVLVAGGSNGAYLASAEVFDPATGSFSAVGSMGIDRFAPVAAPLPDGRVLVAGGYSDFIGDYVASAEVFNPATNSFSSAGIGSMGTPREYAAAAPLRDGRVLVAGGEAAFAAPLLASAEVFNPASNSFSSAGIGSMGSARSRLAAAPLPDGRVLVAGGYTGTSPLASAEAFDPATNSFSSAGIGSLGTARYGAAAATLPDGRVLVAGGHDATSRLASAEIFAASNAFTVKVKGKRLLVSVSAAGKVDIAAAAAKKRKLLLKPSSASGGPGTITVQLALTKRAKKLLKKKGKLKLSAMVTFTPQGGLANTQIEVLKLTGKKKK